MVTWGIQGHSIVNLSMIEVGKKQLSEKIAIMQSEVEKKRIKED